jgi:hypothetical protein
MSPDARGPAVSDARRKKAFRSLRAVAGPAAEVGPGGTRRARAETGDGPLGSEGKRAAGKGVGLPTENRKEKRIPFSFSFSNISKHFQIILNPLLNLNQTTHLKNLNATA